MAGFLVARSSPYWRLAHHVAAQLLGTAHVPAVSAAAGVCSATVPCRAASDDVSAADTLSTLSGTSFAEGLEYSRAPAHGPMAIYLAGVHEQKYRRDERQEQTMAMLQQLYEELQGVQKKGASGLTIVQAAQQPAKQSSWWSDLLGGAGDSDSGAAGTAAPKGVYMFGGVGCGKTMMMDILARSAEGPSFKTLRIHFHDFMLDVHARLRGVQKSQDPLAAVASDIAANTRLLCLDEFFVTDVADAMILSRLFEHLWTRGVVLVATSNRHPDKLYENGLQRQLFLPFIAALKSACHVHDLASPVDYRRLAKNERGTYFTGPSASSDLQARVQELLPDGERRRDVVLPVRMGRTVRIPEVAGCVAKFTFGELCGQALGAADFIALCTEFHTIAIDGLPMITAAHMSQAYRFVTLIDVAYEHRCRLLIAAAAPPAELFKLVYTHSDAKEALAHHDVADEEVVIDESLGFAKDRTISRLIEMQSDEYREQHARQRAPHLLQALLEAKRAG